MTRLLFIGLACTLSILCHGKEILVNNVKELHEASNSAQPGDVIILKNGEWKNAQIRLQCKGTEAANIIVRAETPGKVLLTGNSKLKLATTYTRIEGLHFVNGFAGKDAVISFRIDKDYLANHTRVTNSVISSYNNEKRMDENTWVLLYGKHNRVDNCSFIDKQNMGVLMAVILDDERSRENFHSIDHNYFGKRLPLASNTGEIIRVGVSQHCQYNSNTNITDNYFDRCDGEAEVISIKSGSNLVKGNLINESQGSIVLRHGDYNTVMNNVIYGNSKEGTGGIRLVGKGQWVVNNFLFGCRGVDFRSPLTVMNGIPNSPAHRYVQVTDAVIANNSFYNCSPVSFCDGSDAERTLPPDNVFFQNNLFFNDRDLIIYRAYDNVAGFRFAGNAVNDQNKQDLFSGFFQTSITTQKNDNRPFPIVAKNIKTSTNDSLQTLAGKRLGQPLSSVIGFDGLNLLKHIQGNAFNNTGAKWFSPKSSKIERIDLTECKNAEEVYEALVNTKSAAIRLTGTEYHFDRPLVIRKTVVISADERVSFSSGDIHTIFEIGGKGNLVIEDISIDGSKVKAHNFITTDSTGPVNHFNLKVSNTSIENLKSSNGCKNFFHARKSIVADSIIIRNNRFTNNDVDYFEMNSEKDDKGYYTAEKIIINKNEFSNASGVLLDIYRGGNDESTLGPNLTVTENKFSNCKGGQDDSFINLVGVQRSRISQNKFENVNDDTQLIKYTDRVRAYHFLEENLFQSSGKITANEFVINRNNTIK